MASICVYVYIYIYTRIITRASRALDSLARANARASNQMPSTQTMHNNPCGIMVQIGQVGLGSGRKRKQCGQTDLKVRALWRF